MATRKITITVPEELVESIKARVDSRGVSGYIAAAAAHQDAMDRLRELTERLEAEHGPVSEDEQQAALDRIAAIDDWHDEQRSRSGAAA
jgi:anti-sigma factor ChrR (cupin superfamily)